MKYEVRVVSIPAAPTLPSDLVSTSIVSCVSSTWASKEPLEVFSQLLNGMGFKNLC